MANLQFFHAFFYDRFFFRRETKTFLFEEDSPKFCSFAELDLILHTIGIGVVKVC